jgi:hypothetical protein
MNVRPSSNGTVHPSAHTPPHYSIHNPLVAIPHHVSSASWRPRGWYIRPTYFLLGDGLDGAKGQVIEVPNIRPLRDAVRNVGLPAITE